MNVIFLSCENIAGNYGIGSYANTLTRELSTHSYINIIDIEVFSTKNAEISIQKSGNITRIYIPKPSMTGNITSMKEQEKHIYAKRLAALIKEYIEELPDAVIHLNYHVLIFIAQHLREHFNYPIIYVTHVLYWKILLGMRPDLHQKSLMIKTAADQQEMFRHYRTRTEELTFQIAERFIFVTDYGAKNLGMLYNIPESKKKLVYNGISIETGRALSPSEKARLKMEMGFNKHDPIILFCGRLDPGKGIYHLINSFRALLKVQPAAKLIMIGSGEYDPVLTAIKGIAPYVTITGFIPKEEVYNYYRIADVGVIPSLHEQCSYVAIEMMLHALPIVASSIDGLSEMFKDGSTALMVNTYTNETAGIVLNENMLTDRINLLLNDPAYATVLSKNAKAYAEKEFSGNKMATDTISVYKEALSIAKKRNISIPQ